MYDITKQINMLSFNINLINLIISQQEKNEQSNIIKLHNNETITIGIQLFTTAI